MGLIISFIDHSVQPGTSFSNTPTLEGFKELFKIARRFVAQAPTSITQKTKRQPYLDGRSTHLNHAFSSDEILISNIQHVQPIELPVSLKIFSCFFASI